MLFGGRLFFGAGDDTNGSQLWASDGTPEGTELFVNIQIPGSDASCVWCHPYGWPRTVAGDRLFFASIEGIDLENLEGAHGNEALLFGLWASDGTTDGTFKIRDLGKWPCIEQQGPGGCLQSTPTFFHALNKLFFTAQDPRYGVELWAFPLDSPPLPRFRRADPNSSGTTDISDAISIFGFLFLGDPQSISCMESADTNNDGTIDISDGIGILSWLFAGGPEPAAPGPTGAPCGVDPDPPGSAGDLGCEVYASCQ